ncbi:M15 family metallopeptidase [Neptunitalea chrysea]|nr:M15 family metallopeptidase [Neptunitalea chrysea]
MFKFLLLFLSVLIFSSCADKTIVESHAITNIIADTGKVLVMHPVAMDSVKPKLEMKDLELVPDTTFVRLADYSDNFVFDMRYATPNNFLKTTVYDCAECYTRSKTAQQLIKANRSLLTRGYKIKFFDCYRPLDVQKKMWKIVPNPMYVADPAKGSIHNRGGAVDITLVDSLGNELPMGTGFDFFGKEAHHTYTDLPQEVLDNRKLLKTTMEAYGFKSIESEWWHYNLASMIGASVANFVWECKD